MATQVKIKVEAESDYIYVFDKTGVYSSQNQTGWGLPNTVISAVTSAVLDVYLPGTNSNPATVNVFPNLPNTNEVGYEISAETLNLESLPAGIYRIDYRLQATGGVVLSESVLFYHYRSLECCITAKKRKLSITDATSDKALEVLELETLLENSIWAACSGDYESATEISEYISAKCECCGCGC